LRTPNSRLMTFPIIKCKTLLSFSKKVQTEIIFYLNLAGIRGTDVQVWKYFEFQSLKVLCLIIFQHVVTFFLLINKLNWNSFRNLKFSVVRGEMEHLHLSNKICCVLGQGTLNRGSIDWQISTRFSCLKLAVMVF